MEEYKYKIINNEFDFINITEKDKKLILYQKLNCLNKPLFIQNDLNIQSVMNVSPLLKKIENILKVRVCLELMLENSQRGSIENPIFNDIINFLKSIKIENKKRLTKKINLFFIHLSKSSKSYIKYKIKEISLLDKKLSRIEHSIRKKFNISDKNFYSNIHNHLLSTILYNHTGFLNLSVLSSLEAHLSEYKKVIYPKNILSYDLERILLPRELIIQNKIITFYLCEKFNHKRVPNEILDYFPKVSNKRSHEYHVYNLLSFLIIYDFLIKHPDIKNTSISDIENFFDSCTELTLPAIYIINNIKNYDSIFCSKELRKILEPKMEGYNKSGVETNGKHPRKHKNTVFDLSEAIMSNLLFDKDKIYNIYLTKDKDIELFFKMLKISNNNNKITFYETELLNNCNIYKYQSTLKKINQNKLFENKIYNNTKNETFYTKDKKFNDLYKKTGFSVDYIKEVALEYFSLGHDTNTILNVWNYIKSNKNFQYDLLGSEDSIVKMLYGYSFLINGKEAHTETINLIEENLSLLNGFVIEALANEVIKKRQELKLDAIELNAYHLYEKK